MILFEDRPPRRLFKFLPENFVESVLDGKLLFRNLVYFKKLDSDSRSDPSEGTHIDKPNNPIKINNLSTGKTISGNFAFHNTIANPDRVFCFCVSQQFDKSLHKFGDACIEFLDPLELIRRIEKTLQRRNRVSKLEKPFLLSDRIRYYKKDWPAPEEIDIKNPRHLPFLKQDRFADEAEFRFVFAKKNGFLLKEIIVNENFDEASESAGYPSTDNTIKIGNIRDIASVRDRS